MPGERDPPDSVFTASMHLEVVDAIPEGIYIVVRDMQQTRTCVSDGGNTPRQPHGRRITNCRCLVLVLVSASLTLDCINFILFYPSKSHVINAERPKWVWPC